MNINKTGKNNCVHVYYDVYVSVWQKNKYNPRNHNESTVGFNIISINF